MQNTLEIPDHIVITLYFLIVLFIGLYYASAKSKTADDYFFAGRGMGWLFIGFSIFATNISSEHIAGLASAGFKSGLIVGHFEWLAIFFILTLGWVFTPVFFKSKINTIPELMGNKYNSKVRKFYSALSIFTYIITKIAISLLAGGILLYEIFGWNFYVSVTIMILFTGLYTIIGGLRSVMYTQIFQAVILILGGVAVVYFGLMHVGGVSEFLSKLPANYFDVFRPLKDNEFPWLGILLGAPILAAWYWWADQYIVQRILSAKNIAQAKKGTLFGAALKTFPFLFLILPGMIALEMQGNSSNGVYSTLFNAGIFPAGIQGLIISGIFAAIMSSLASAFNSTATLIAYDFFDNGKTKNNDDQLILIGRLSTIFIVVVSILFIPMLRLFDNGIYVNLQKLQAYISPPIVLVFILALIMKKHSAKAALLTLIFGEAVGFIRIAADIIFARNLPGFQFLEFIRGINYLYFAAILFLLSGGAYYIFRLIFGTETAANSENGVSYDINKLNIHKQKKEVSL